jgi:hypothetical protein
MELVDECPSLVGVLKSDCVLAKPNRRMTSTGELQLGQKVVDVRFGRGQADVQAARDFLVRQSRS